MIGSFIRRLLRGEVARPIPEPLWQETLTALPFLARLDADELARLRSLAEQFLAEKEFSTAGPLELSDAMCVSIAVQGCLPILNLGLDHYRGWVGIVVYPDEFVIPRSIQDEDGIVHEYDEVASGEAWGGGPLLVSWRDVQMAGEGYNVVIHEFAHKLDMENGEADGIPPLPPGISREVWDRTLLDAYEDFCVELDAADEAGLDTEIDPYATEHPGELFAVLSELFFEQPELVQRRFPEFHALLARFYRIDLANRTTG